MAKRSRKNFYGFHKTQNRNTFRSDIAIYYIYISTIKSAENELQISYAKWHF